MKSQWFPAVICSLVLAGCASNDTYRRADFAGDKVYKKGPFLPQLNENEVLGLSGAEKISDEEIQRVLDESRLVRLKPGSNVLLVQSGVPHPDAAMVRELSREFTVIPYTGVPSELRPGEDGAALAKSLRLAAAHNHAESILVYWGNLEMKRNEMPTSIVSWVPVVDFTVPDEIQKVRMYLKVALIDVRTGSWATFRTEAVEDEALTTRYARERDQKWSLDRTKKRLYESAAKKIAAGFMASR